VNSANMFPIAAPVAAPGKIPAAPDL
jgi:hypothetical protein